MGDPDEKRARSLRADAVRNRECILTTARELFARRGISVTLNDLAHEAGVGVGTVYRHFPDKDAVILALVSQKFDTLFTLVQRAGEEPDPREAVRGYLRGIFELRAQDSALDAAIARARMAAPGIEQRARELDSKVRNVLRRAHDARVVRPGLAETDIPVFITMLGSVIDATRDVHPGLWRRYAELLIDAVCPPDGAHAIIGCPLTQHPPPHVAAHDLVRPRT